MQAHKKPADLSFKETLEIFKRKPLWDKIITLIFMGGIVFIFTFVFYKYYEIDKEVEMERTKLIEEQKEREKNKSVYEQNMDFARELDRMNKAAILDEQEKERREINKYRQHK